MREELVKLISEHEALEYIGICDSPEVEVDGEKIGVVTRMESTSIGTLQKLADVMISEMNFLGTKKLFIRSVELVAYSGKDCYKLRYAFV